MPCMHVRMYACTWPMQCNAMSCHVGWLQTHAYDRCVPLSSNEIARIRQEEDKHRRTVRLQQVRQQEKLHAQLLRNTYKQTRDYNKHKLKQQLQDRWEAARQQHLRIVQVPTPHHTTWTQQHICSHICTRLHI